MQIKTGDVPITLSNTPNRYPVAPGAPRNQPGWQYYTESKTSAPTTKALTARFDLQATNDYLHVSIPGSIEREYTSALAPPTQEVKNGYDKKDTQMFIMRKYGEAWDEPFVALYEPSGNALSTIKSSDYIYDGGKVVGVKVVSDVNGQEIVDYVLSNDSNDETVTLTDLDIVFSGRFGIVRKEVKTGATDVSLYIGEGQQLTFRDQTVSAYGEGKAYLEYSLDFELSTDDLVNLEERIFAYPNPTTGSFEINIPKYHDNVRLEVYNIHAQLIVSKLLPVNNGYISLDISDRAEGIYFVKINLEKPVHLKVIKK